MIANIHWSQAQLAKHWQVSEGTLERWRSEGIGPIYLKLMGHVQYRLSDISAYGEDCLRMSTSMRAPAPCQRQSKFDTAIPGIGN